MGSVFKARQKSMDRVVALKVLPPKVAKQDPLFVERFIREARVAAQLDHPNIVRGIEIGQDEASRLYYFSMEYVDGPNLGQILKRQGPFKEPRALKIMLDVTEALIYTDSKGIVHRDIKPDNILITSRREVKLADLGLARKYSEAFHADAALVDTQGEASDIQIDEPLTLAGKIVGTPHYMAPEQILGQSEKLDIRTDLYALGATLFHLVTGQRPFGAGTGKEVMRRCIRDPVPSAQATNPAVSSSTDALIGRLMQKDPKDRIQTPQELKQALIRCLPGSKSEGSRYFKNHYFCRVWRIQRLMVLRTP